MLRSHLKLQCTNVQWVEEENDTIIGNLVLLQSWGVSHDVCKMTLTFPEANENLVAIMNDAIVMFKYTEDGYIFGVVNTATSDNPVNLSYTLSLSSNIYS